MTLEATVEGIEDEAEKAAFLEFAKGMLQWRPEDRKTARELADDPWLRA